MMRFRWWLVTASGIFITGLLLGWLLPPDAGGGVVAEQMEALAEAVQELQPFTVSAAAFILANNIFALLLSFMMSPLLCLVPVAALLLNGGLLSMVAVMVARETSISTVIIALLPHGMLELPSFIIGEAAALSFGAMVLASLFSSEARKQLLPTAVRDLKYLALACALLLPAAFIETFITPLFLG